MEKRNSKLVYVAYAVFTIGLLIRAAYGFCWTDEAYYVSATNRFLKGDRFLTDDWYLSQLYSVVLLPILYIYKSIENDFVGVYLFLRIIYVLGQTVLAIGCYKVLEKSGIKSKPAFCTSLVILFYCRAYIITLSYYSVIFIFFILLLLLLYNYQSNEQIKALFIGICISVLTIINPYFVGLYLICLCVLLYYNISLQKQKQTIKKYNQLFWFSGISISICIILVAIVILKGNSITEILHCIPIILNEEGYSNSFIVKIIKALTNTAKQFIYTLFPIIITFILSVYSFWKNNFSGRRKDIIFICSFVIFVLNCMNSNNWSGGIQTAFAIFGLNVFLLDENRNIKVFKYFFLPGLILALMMNFCSDTGFSAMTLGYTISGAASCIFVYDYIRHWHGRIVHCIGIISICIVVIVPAFFRVCMVYRDSELSNLNVLIEEGPAKGLYTTYEHAKQYEDVRLVMKEYCKEEGMVFVSSWCPWAYLCTDMKCGAYTTWNLKMEKNEDKLKRYYQLYPNRVPDVVIQLNDDIGKIDILKYFNDLEWLAEKPQADKKRQSSFLWEYIEKEYEKIPVSCGVVWRKRNI